MIDDPFRLQDPREVRLGDVVLDDKWGRLVIDEVRQTTDGVKLLGWPDYRQGSGRRQTVDAVDKVRVAPTRPELLRLREALLGMATDAVQYHLDKRHTVPSGDDCEAVPFDTDGDRIILVVGGRKWLLDLEELPEVGGEDPGPQDGLE